MSKDIKYWLDDITFDFEASEDNECGPHIAYTLAENGFAASGLNTPYLLKSEDRVEITKEFVEKLKGLGVQVSLTGDDSGSDDKSVSKDGNASPKNDPDNPQGDLMDIQDVLKSEEGKNLLAELVEKALEPKLTAQKEAFEIKFAAQDELIKAQDSKEEKREKADLLEKAKAVGVAEDKLEETVNEWYSAIKGGFEKVVTDAIAMLNKSKVAMEESDLFKDIDSREESTEEKEYAVKMREGIAKAQGIKLEVSA